MCGIVIPGKLFPRFVIEYRELLFSPSPHSSPVKGEAGKKISLSPWGRDLGEGVSRNHRGEQQLLTTYKY